MKAIGGVGIGALAGCTGGGDGGDGSSGDGGDGGDGGGDGGGGDGGSTTQSDEPVRVGWLTPTSGPFATLGQELTRGMEFAQEELGGEILGRPLEIVSRDSEGVAETALSRAQELAESEDVDAIIGPVSSAVGVSIIPYIKSSAQVPFVPAFTASTTIRETPDYCNRYTFFPFASNRHHAIAIAEFTAGWFSDNTDVDTSSAYLFSLDYEAGQSFVDLLTEYFEANGTEVEGQTMAPIGTRDWASYLQEIQSADSEMISGWLPEGPVSISFVQAAKSFGLPDEKTFNTSGDVTGNLTMGALDGEADGFYGTHYYNLDADIDLNNRFKSWYNDHYDAPGPTEIPTAGFNDLYSLAQGMENAGTTAVDDVISAMEGMTWDSPSGPLTYRAEDHQTELNYFGYRVEDNDRVKKADYPDTIGEAFCSV